MLPHIILPKQIIASNKQNSGNIFHNIIQFINGINPTIMNSVMPKSKYNVIFRSTLNLGLRLSLIILNMYMVTTSNNMAKTIAIGVLPIPKSGCSPFVIEINPSLSIFKLIIGNKPH